MTLPELRPETDLVVELEPALVWHIDFERNTMVGTVDGVEAVVQLARLALGIRRYRHLIFSWQVGNEQFDLIGKDIDLIHSESKRMITEALSTIPHIMGVRDFRFQGEHVSFTIDTVFGSQTLERRMPDDNAL